MRLVEAPAGLPAELATAPLEGVLSRGAVARSIGEATIYLKRYNAPAGREIFLGDLYYREVLGERRGQTEGGESSLPESLRLVRQQASLYG
jgi:hypothetical protein